MSRVTRCAPALAVAVLLAATACMGDEGTRVTLTGDDCTYQGPETFEAGTESTESFDLENESDETGIFELVQIEPSGSVEELNLYVAEEQRRIDEGTGAGGTPDFVTVVIQLEVDPGEVGVLTSGLETTTYAILCSSGTPPTGVHVGTVFDAT